MIDLTGQSFSKLTVLSRAENDKHGQAQWLCRCECGTIKTIRGAHLRKGETISCECAQRKLRAQDMTGQRFGSLVVLSRSELKGSKLKDPNVYWLCQCDCGRQKVVQGAFLRSGTATNCGCQSKTRFMDLTGRRFGRLTVLSQADNDQAGRTRWLCQCECGKQKTVLTLNLVHGNTKSCGCLRTERKAKKEA